MAIEKMIPPASEMDEMYAPGEGIQVEVVDFEIEPVEISFDITPEGDVIESGLAALMGEEAPFDANLAETMDESELGALVAELLGDFEADVSARQDWVQAYVDGLELLGLKIEERTEPWSGACGVYHPLLSEALVKFQAETMMETFPAQGPVKTQIIGEETPEKLEAAARVRADMNYQLTEKMVEYRPEHERMLWGLGLAGNAFKKVYYDPGLERQVSLYVPAEDVVVPYGASSLETSERVTHVMRKTKNEVRKLQVAGFYLDVELDEPSDTFDEIERKIAEKLGFRATMDDRYKLLEMHVELELPDHVERFNDGTGVALPYVVTIEKGSSKVLAIRRNWHPDDPTRQKRNHFVHYSYIPGFGFYAFGLIHLIGTFAKSGTSLMRQLVDAGTLSNLPGGFKTKGLRIKGDDTPIAPAEFRDVDVASGTIRDNIMALPYKEPSAVLFSLLQNIVEEGRRFASAADMKVSDMSAQAPVGTTLAVLERTLKVMSAVQARIHFAMRQEFKLLKAIIRDYTPESYSYAPEKADPQAKRGDYDFVEVIPVSDPNSATMAQKVVQYQAAIQLAGSAPQIYDMPELHRQMLSVLGIKNVEKLVPLKDDHKPMEPVSENMAILTGKPVKAFIHQDHAAHMEVHAQMLQDPLIQQMVGQSPMAGQIMGAIHAHLAEHMAFEYRKQLEEQAGVPYPGPEEELDPSIEVQVSRLAAAASRKLLQKNTAEAAQKQAQEAMQDPIVQMKMQELQIKAQDAEVKKQKMLIDAAAKRDQLALEQARLASQERIAGLQVGAKVATDKEKLSAQQQLEGLRIGAKIATDKEKLSAQQQLEGLRIGVQVAKEVATGSQQTQTPLEQTPKPENS